MIYTVYDVSLKMDTWTADTKTLSADVKPTSRWLTSRFRKIYVVIWWEEAVKAQERWPHSRREGRLR
jgi:hypothetical protein